MITSTSTSTSAHGFLGMAASLVYILAIDWYPLISPDRRRLPSTKQKTQCINSNRNTYLLQWNKSMHLNKNKSRIVENEEWCFCFLFFGQLFASVSVDGIRHQLRLPQYPNPASIATTRNHAVRNVGIFVPTTQNQSPENTKKTNSSCNCELWWILVPTYHHINHNQ